MTKRTNTKLVGAAVAGLFAGLTACGGGDQPAGQPEGVKSTPPPVATQATPAAGEAIATAATDLNICKGRNTCKGKGGCKSGDGGCAGLNSCAGKGGCASMAARHDCAGKNTCKGLGGCKTGDGGCAGKNSCKGKGGCAVPVTMS